MAGTVSLSGFMHHIGLSLALQLLLVAVQFSWIEPPRWITMSIGPVHATSHSAGIKENKSRCGLVMNHGLVSIL